MRPWALLAGNETIKYNAQPREEKAYRGLARMNADTRGSGERGGAGIYACGKGLLRELASATEEFAFKILTAIGCEIHH
jgi:hypothetical protein